MLSLNPHTIYALTASQIETVSVCLCWENTNVSCLCYFASAERRRRPHHGRLHSPRQFRTFFLYALSQSRHNSLKPKSAQRDGELRGSAPSLFRPILSEILSLINCFVTLDLILCYFDDGLFNT